MINLDKPPRNFRDAMKALDKQAWATAYNSEYLGFQQREVFKIVKPEPWVRIHDTITRLEYKEDSWEFLKYKVRLCARGGQQIPGVSFRDSDLLSSTQGYGGEILIGSCSSRRSEGHQDQYQASLLVRGHGR